MQLLVIAVIVGVVYGQAAPASMTSAQLDALIDQVIADTDINADGVISLTEAQNELLGAWDTNADSSIHKVEFGNAWSTAYAIDSLEWSEAFFDCLDAFPDGNLGEFDILLQMGSLDPNSDGTITVAEFRAFIHMKHPSGVGTTCN